VGLLAASAFLITIAKRSGYYGSFGQDVPTAISSLGSGYDWSEAWMSALSAGGYFLLVICLCFGIWWFDKTVFKNAKAEFTTRDIWIRRGSLCLLIGLLVPSALIMLGNEGGRRMAANRAYGYGHQRIPNIDLKKLPTLPPQELTILGKAVENLSVEPFIEVGRTDRGILYFHRKGNRVFEIDPKDGVVLNVTPVQF